MRLYLDTAPVIYFLESQSPLDLRVADRLAQPGVEYIASTLTRLECLVVPIRAGDQTRVADFERFFERMNVEMVSLTDAVMAEATRIRAHYGFKTPDAIHLAAAVTSRCDVFYTHDLRLRRFSGVAVETV